MLSLILYGKTGDCVKKDTLAEIEHERRMGYSYYTNAPLLLLTKEYPVWQKKYAPENNVVKETTEPIYSSLFGFWFRQITCIEAGKPTFTPHKTHPPLYQNSVSCSQSLQDALRRRNPSLFLKIYNLSHPCRYLHTRTKAKDGNFPHRDLRR